MAKKKKDIKIKLNAGIGNADPMEVFTSLVNKKGKFVGNGKKEKKKAKEVCQHNFIKNRNELKKFIRSDGKGNCYCRFCQAKIRADYLSDKEVKTRESDFVEVLDQCMIMNAAVGYNKEVGKYLVGMRSGAKNVGNTYNKLKKATSKNDKVKGTKHKKKEAYRPYGNWDVH